MNNRVIKAYGYALTIPGKEVIKKMAKNVLGLDVHITDVRSQKIVGIEKTDLVWAFGNQASLALAGTLDNLGYLPNNIFFPELSLIIPPGDPEVRKKVLESLEILKENLSTPVVKNTEVIVTRESLSNLNAKEIEDISNRKKEWTGVLEDGRKIRVTDELPPDDRYDINMKFSELVALKVAMEHFEVKEFHLVNPKKNNNDAPNKDNNR
jgi:hypothetical protein